MMWNGWGYGNWGWGGGSWDWIGMIFMMIFGVVVIGLIIWGAMRIGGYGYPMNSGYHDQNALDIAKERYAKGEIDQEKYEQIRKALS